MKKLVLVAALLVPALSQASVYTPTVTNVAHAGNLSASKAQHSRANNVMRVSGSVTVASDSGTELTQVRVSLPIASNLTDVEDCHGVLGEAANFNTGAVKADPATDSVIIEFLASVSDASFSYPLKVNFTFDCEVK